MKTLTFCPILAALVLVAASTAFGGPAPGQHSARISPLIRPKAECDGWSFLLALYELTNEVWYKIQDGIKATKETIGGPEDFDLALKNLDKFEEGALAKTYEIFLELAEKYPYDCDDVTFFHLFFGSARTSVERAASTLAAISFLKSPELYEVVKEDMATRVAVVEQLIRKIDALIDLCQPYAC